MTRYALALILPQEVEYLLDELRGEHHAQMTYITIPHITLGYFVTDMEPSTIKESLAQMAEDTAPLNIKLNGVSYFEGEANTAYVAIENHEPVIRLRVGMLHCLQLVSEIKFEERSDLEQYHPHITIGTDICALAFAAIKEMLSEQEARLEVLADTFALGSIGDDGKWRIESFFKLTG